MITPDKYEPRHSSEKLAAILSVPGKAKLLTEYSEWCTSRAENDYLTFVALASARLTGNCNRRAYDRAVVEIAKKFDFSVYKITVIAEWHMAFIEQSLSDFIQSPLDFDWNGLC